MSETKYNIIGDDKGKMIAMLKDAKPALKLYGLIKDKVKYKKGKCIHGQCGFLAPPRNEFDNYWCRIFYELIKPDKIFTLSTMYRYIWRVI